MIDPNKVILDSEQSDAIIGAQAAEIRRLRLTDEEREAIAYFAVIEGDKYLPAANTAAATLRSLLERLHT
jgi:hypothetical protein